MPEPIDREVTLLLLDVAIKQFGENWLQDKLTKNGLLIAKQIVSKQPTIEAEPVRRGRWIPLEGWFNKSIVKCSACGNTLDMDGVNAGRGDANFCPNCGVKMDAADTNVVKGGDQE